MSWLNAVLVTYAVFVIGAGAEAYFSKGSIASLMGAGAIGVLVLIGVFVTKTRPSIGYGIAALGPIMALGRFLPSYMKDHKVWPALIIVIASFAALACLVAGHFMNRPKP